MFSDVDSFLYHNGASQNESPSNGDPRDVPSRDDIEEVHKVFPKIDNTPLWCDPSKTFVRWWSLVKQLPDYKLAPKTVTALVQGIVDKFVSMDTCIMGLLRVFDVAVAGGVETLHIPLVYINVHNAFEKTKKMPYAYLVAVAKTLTLRRLLHGTPADEYIHWAEKQLPASDRVFIVPHPEAAAEPPAEVQQLVAEAVPKATTEFTAMLWRLVGSFERFSGSFPRKVSLPAIDLDKRQVYGKVLKWGDVVDEGVRDKLQAIIDAVDKKETDALERARLEWFDSIRLGV